MQSNLNGTQTLIESAPICGYNKDNKFYCPTKIGDSEFVTKIDIIKQAIDFANINCHPLSNTFNFGTELGQGCKALSSHSEYSKAAFYF